MAHPLACFRRHYHSITDNETEIGSISSSNGRMSHHLGNEKYSRAQIYFRNYDSEATYPSF